MARGLRNDAIADELFIARKTVAIHVSHILAKPGVQTRTEAASLAYRAHLIAEGGDEVGASRQRQS